MDDGFWYWTLGGVLVLIYAVQRFNTPPSNRLSTTRPSYYGALGLYLLALAFLYVMLGGGLTSSPEIVGFLAQAGAFPADWAAEDGTSLPLLPGPLLAALILTNLLPNTRLAAFDSWLRKVCWDAGHIPRAARQLGAQMRRSRFQAPALFRKAIETKLADIAPEHIRFEPEDSLEHAWTRLTGLHVMVSDWKRQDLPKYQQGEIEGWSEPQKRRWMVYDRVPQLLKSDFERLDRDYEALRPRAHNLFQITAEIRKRRDANHFQESAVGECEHNFRDRLDALHRGLTHFIAQGVLHCEPDSAARVRQLQAMGFRDITAIERPALPLNTIAGISLGVFLLFICLIAGGLQVMELLGFGVDGLSRATHLPRTAAMVAIIYGLAVLSAVYPKSVWRSFDRRRAPGRRWFAYIFSGLLAVALAGLTVLTFRFALLLDFADGLRSVYWSFPWFWMTFFTGAVTAFMADDFAEQAAAPWWGRWAEGAALAAILVFVATVLVFPALDARAAMEATPSLIPRWVGAAVPEWFLVPPFWVVLPTSASIGFLIGVFVPHEYRRRPAEQVGARDRREPPAGDLIHQV